MQAGQHYEIELHATNFEAIRGFQMTLEYDHSLVSVLDITGVALPESTPANVNLALAEQGRVPLSWHTSEVLSLDSEAVGLRVIIKAHADINLSEALTITSSLTRAEAYGAELMNVALQFSNNDANVTANRFQLFQNQPNPFKDETMIGFMLPEDGELTLRIFDVNGKYYYSRSVILVKVMVSLKSIVRNFQVDYIFTK